MTKATKRAKSSTGASSTTANKIPTPFTKAPAILEPFLEPLEEDEIYLLHVDVETTKVKKQLFIVPILLNIVILQLIFYRAYLGASTYPAMLAAVMGWQTSMSVDSSAMSWGEFGWVILRRTVSFTFDYLLVTLLIGWPIRFIRGPIRWRTAVGFKDREIVVRQSRKSWSKELPHNRWIYDTDSEATVRKKIIPAVHPERLQKSGFLLVDGDWDLDYTAMIRAHSLVDLTQKGEGIPLEEFRNAVLVHTDSHGWLIWRFGEQPKVEVVKNAQRDRILAFQEKLASMGKEDLFFRWVELIQFESTQPGGFTPERQKKAMLEAKQLFEDQGVDFAQFWKEVGGMEGISLDE